MSGYFRQADPEAIARDFPLGESFAGERAQWSADVLSDWQAKRFREVIDRAWQVPFYQRRWRAVGLEPGDIAGPADLTKIPPFTKQDLMESVAAYPPLGDYHGRDGEDWGQAHWVLHTTSGTTGDPQPIPFGARDREIQNALLARAYRMQGVRDDDVIHSVYGFGMVNGGHYVREAALHYLPCLYVPAGTGVDTPSTQQIALMRRFGATETERFNGTVYIFDLLTDTAAGDKKARDYVRPP